MRKALWLAILAASVIGGVAIAALPASAGGRPLTAELLGSNEVNGGDPDGAGSAFVTLNQGQGEVCFELTYSDIDTPTRAHIHRGAAGVNGPIVVPFFDFVAPPPSDGCVSADEKLVKEIRKNPENFYVNIHNADFPGGAIRGQLSR